MLSHESMVSWNMSINNQVTIYIAVNPILQEQTKHIEFCHPFIIDMVITKKKSVALVGADNQIAVYSAKCQSFFTFVKTWRDKHLCSGVKVKYSEIGYSY